MTPPDIKPSHVLVTGATGGIGRAVCLELATRARDRRQPLHLTVASTAHAAKLDALLDELSALDATASPAIADLTDAAQCVATVDAAIGAHGHLDALICVAGASRASKLADLDVEQWDHCFALNTRPVFVMAQAARASLAHTRGSITAVASMSGLEPHPGLGAYSAAKAALLMLCRQLAQEWGELGIRTNCVSPGMIRTPLTEAIYASADVTRRREALVPLGRIGRAEEIARAIAFLASDEASYVNGANLVVDGGVADHMLAMIPGRPGAT